jgi:hypothetical protein
MMRIRADLLTAQEHAWERIGRPGSWWTGAERVAIAAETRHAVRCQLCIARRAALSPAMVAGDHSSLCTLPAAAVEAIHRIRTDSGRLSEVWYRQVLDGGLSEERYVELVAIAAIVVAVDTFRTALGVPSLELPQPCDGAPLRLRPRGARRDVAWMATLAPEDRAAADPDLYREHPGPRERYGANIHRALSLVPHAMMQWWDMFECMYLTSPSMRDFGREYRAVTHAQIELLAARVAALNRCHY